MSEELTRVVGVLTAQERTAILDRYAPEGSLNHGARVDDILSFMDQHDIGVDKTDPFWDEHGAHLRWIPEVSWAVLVLVALDQELTMDAVAGLLARGGIAARDESPPKA